MNSKLLANAFPINKIEVFFDNLDHSSFLGFTWEQVGAGRVPVGLDTSQTEFNTIGKTGGSKYLQEHTHNSYKGARLVVANGVDYAVQDFAVASDQTFTTSTAGTGNSGNLQPYIVMAFWKRVA